MKKKLFTALTLSIIPRSLSSDYASPQGLLLYVITYRFGLIVCCNKESVLLFRIYNSSFIREFYPKVVIFIFKLKIVS